MSKFIKWIIIAGLVLLCIFGSQKYTVLLGTATRFAILAGLLLYLGLFLVSKYKERTVWSLVKEIYENSKKSAANMEREFIPTAEQRATRVNFSEEYRPREVKEVKQTSSLDAQKRSTVPEFPTVGFSEYRRPAMPELPKEDAAEQRATRVNFSEEYRPREAKEVKQPSSLNAQKRSTVPEFSTVGFSEYRRPAAMPELPKNYMVPVGDEMSHNMYAAPELSRGSEATRTRVRHRRCDKNSN